MVFSVQFQCTVPSNFIVDGQSVFNGGPLRNEGVWSFSLDGFFEGRLLFSPFLGSNLSPLFWYSPSFPFDPSFEFSSPLVC